MTVSVLGCGRWGTFLAWYLHRLGHDVTLYGRPGSGNLRQLAETRRNEYLELPEDVRLTDDLARALQNRVVLISVPSQALRSLMGETAALGAKEKLFVLCMKGLEIGSGMRLSQVVAETAGPDCRNAVWLGPGHVEEFVRGIPNCMVIDAEAEEDKQELVKAFSGELIRFYYGNDLLGNEIGAAAKNVVGIAAGMLDGLGLSSLKGALMSRGTREFARLIKVLGGSELSAYGLCHLGDYEATMFNLCSHNRMFGEQYVKGIRYDCLAEGYFTIQALLPLAGEAGVELPITQALSDILYGGMEPKLVLDSLFRRSIKNEF